MMLKKIPALMDAELLWVLASMGHGDEIAIVDRNFSAHRVARKTTTGKLIVLPGLDAPTAIAGILELFPLDAFVASPLSHMGGPQGEHERILEVHADVIRVCSEAEGRQIASTPLERFAYYPIAEASFAVVQTAEARPYGNFILKKGVV
jgi:L-fucose mutarotase